MSARVDGIDSHIGRLEDTIHSNFATILTRIDSLQSSSTPAAVPSQPPPPCQVRIAEESSEQRSSSFAKVIPNIRALSQVWLVYTAIRDRHSQDLDLNDTLLAYLEILIEFDQIYSWKGVTEYHLAICCQRFGTGVTHEWAHTDTPLQGCTLLTNFRIPTAPSSGTPGSKPTKSS
ncbi:hypothetical protein NDA18_003079 [Ustilago nuda]|nr:hypothetical protein NDA18_003079 [Ustilago nuda]